MKVGVPAPHRAWALLQDIRTNRADIDPKKDQAKFNVGWAGPAKLNPDSPEFRHGQQPHQKAMAEALEFEYQARSKALEAVRSEREGYLNTLVLVTAAVSLWGGLKGISGSPSPWALLLLVPMIALWMLLGSHASRPKTHLGNYEGPGARAAEIQCRYDMENRKRTAIIRRNAELQRAKRNLATVCLLFQAGILAGATWLIVAVVFG